MATFGITVIAHLHGEQFVTSVRTDENGRFSFADLPPGGYSLAAVDSGPGLLLPEMVDKVGKVLTVGEGESASLELPLTTIDLVRIAREQ